MHDPIATGRSAALRAVAIQAAAALLVAGAVWLLAGPMAGLAAVAGGLAMLAGNALAAVVALGGGIQSAGAAFARLMLGTLGKWVVVIAVLAVALGPLRLPALPAVGGMAAGMLAYLLALNLDSADKRHSNTRQQR